uniref:Rubicon PI3K-binding domain-containing protein n=1 Tax=Plectus sambesii TaxID=2011161 RepID=A0A914XIW9_9BILA
MTVDDVVAEVLNDIVEQVARTSWMNGEISTSTPIRNEVEEGKTNLTKAGVRKTRHNRVLSDPQQAFLLTPPADEEDERHRSFNSSLELEEENQWTSDSWRRAKQSLIDARLHDLEVSRELERENTHLYLSEMLIAAVEQMKWRSVIAGAVLCNTEPRASSTSGIGRSVGEGAIDAVGDESYPASEYSLPSSYDPETSASASTPGSSRIYAHSGTLEQRQVTNPKRSPSAEEEDSKSPEAIAAALLRYFSRKHRQAAGDIDWLVSYADAPQL